MNDQWVNYGPEFFHGHGGISALNIQQDGTIWVATAFDTLVTSGSLSAGGGLYYLKPDSLKWHWIPQPVDSPLDTSDPNIDLPVVTNIQNVTFDIAFDDSSIWITSWGGGIRRSTDGGVTWKVITPDGQPFNVLSNLDHRGFSVMVENGNIWIGTAEGIAKSTDGGKSFQMFKANPDPNSIAGNWCIELKYQPSTGWIWAATIKTFAENEYEFTAVCASPDGGVTWKSFLQEELRDGSFPRYIDFIGDTVLVAAENGLYISPDLGENWYHLNQITDQESGEILTSELFYSVGVEWIDTGFRCWIGAGDGLAVTEDFTQFQVYRRSEPITRDSREKTYAFPNPFTPRHGGILRIKFYIEQPGDVVVDIFNQAMEKVRTLSQSITQISAPTNRDIIWDGKSADGRDVPNGAYFYRVKINGKTYWGKNLVLN
jgi:hypothetical protein